MLSFVLGWSIITLNPKIFIFDVVLCYDILNHVINKGRVVLSIIADVVVVPILDWLNNCRMQGKLFTRKMS